MSIAIFVALGAAGVPGFRSFAGKSEYEETQRQSSNPIPQPKPVYHSGEPRRPGYDVFAGALAPKVKDLPPEVEAEIDRVYGQINPQTARRRAAVGKARTNSQKRETIVADKDKEQYFDQTIQHELDIAAREHKIVVNVVCEFRMPYETVDDKNAHFIADEICKQFDKDMEELRAALYLRAVATAERYQPTPTARSNTGHGHVFPRADGVRMRCGGPGLCAVCSTDQAHALSRAVLDRGRQPE